MVPQSTLASHTVKHGQPSSSACRLAQRIFSHFFEHGAWDDSHCKWLLGDSEPYSWHAMGITFQQSQARMPCHSLIEGPVVLEWAVLAVFSIRQSCKATSMAEVSTAQNIPSSRHALLLLCGSPNSEQDSLRDSRRCPIFNEHLTHT